MYPYSAWYCNCCLFVFQISIYVSTTACTTGLEMDLTILMGVTNVSVHSAQYNAQMHLHVLVSTQMFKHNILR